MENVTVSPSAPAEKQMTPGEARQDLMTLFKKSHSYGGPLNFKAGWTFCACCGSQYMNEEGRVGIAHIPGWVLPSLNGEDAEKNLQSRYGADVKERFSKLDYENTLRIYNRYNKPGVTVAAMEAEKAIAVLYDETKRKIAEGYEIHDEDQGHVVSVIWINE